MEHVRLVIITGLSGAGRSEAMRVFEDLGYFCVDNLPPNLISKFAELLQKSPEVQGAALVMDIRGGVFFSELQGSLNELDASQLPYQILYLEADEETLIRRYKMSRRRHPLETQGRLVDALRKEKEALRELRGKADVIIDTSGLTALQLRQRISDVFRLDGIQSLFQVRLVSFGFKHGLPKDADLVFDVRYLPNPYYVEELRSKTGNDEEVDQYVMRFPQAKETLDKLANLLDFLIPQFQQEGKPQVTIGIGCTGGQHRSVVFANRLKDLLTQAGHQALVEHRDLDLREE
ncbi:MAG: RNase adapter RapZ [Sulfobacillus thermosulfidooxidans]|uniref:RNase adapter RapZ n=1 Tax=Sulfobacillus thermosulfidooxidans TaxID=28034 RepID=A0A2T2WYC7_SULTH|nr:MAG: RNase adapter RapZ [Sulfobacillus thermosulfidooxidans]